MRHSGRNDLQKAVKKAHPSERGRKKEVEAFDSDGRARFYRFTKKGLARRNRKRRARRGTQKRRRSPRGRA